MTYGLMRFKPKEEKVEAEKSEEESEIELEITNGSELEEGNSTSDENDDQPPVSSL